MSRNLNPTFRGQKLMHAGSVEEGLRVVLTTPDVMTDNDYQVATNLTVAGAVALTLPSAGVGCRFRIWDQKGDAGTNNVTITPAAGETINGGATFVINVNYGCVEIVKESSTNWKVVGLSFAAAGAGAVVPSGVTFTQTYSTASATVAALTSHAGTDSTGGAVQAAGNLALLTQTVTGVDGTGSNAASKTDVDARLVVIANSLSTLHAELLLLRADALGNKQNINKVIDAAQAGGLAT